MNAVWAVFNDIDHAEQAVHCLQKNGFGHSQISMVSDNKNGSFGGGGVSLLQLPDVGSVAVEGPLVRTLRDGSALKGLERWNLSEQAMQAVKQALQNGGSFVAVEASGVLRNGAEECLYRYSPCWTSQAERNQANADHVANALLHADDDEEMLTQRELHPAQTGVITFSRQQTAM